MNIRDAMTIMEAAMGAPLSDSQLQHLKRVRTVLRFLATDTRLDEIRHRIRVFGSTTTGKPVPADVDAWIDFSDFSGSVSHPDYVPAGRLISQVVNQYPFFDPFIVVGKITYCKDDRRGGWMQAKNVKVLRAAARAGKPPQEVYAEIVGRPPEQGGKPKPSA